MVSEIVCIFFWGHLYLWKDVPLSAELQDKWTWKGILSLLKWPYEELENAWNKNELNYFFSGKSLANRGIVFLVGLPKMYEQPCRHVSSQNCDWSYAKARKPSLPLPAIVSLSYLKIEEQKTWGKNENHFDIFWQLLLSILWWKMSRDAYRWWIAVSSGRAWKVKQCRCTKWKPWLFPVSFPYLQSKAKTSIYTSYHYTTSILFHADAVATEKEGHM